MARISRYRLESMLGRGGMGEVHRAFDTVLQRPVAIKILSRDDFSGEDDGLRRRVLREARLGASLRHPNVVTIHDVGEDETSGAFFIVMELLDGRTLSDHRIRAEVDVTTKLSWLYEIAAALHHAHRIGLVHRDIKPDNVIVTRAGHVKVLDFGIAKREGLQPLSMIDSTHGGVVGTPTYMAPEQWRGEADARSDQFSWGLLAYELLSGNRPPTEDKTRRVGAPILWDWSALRDAGVAESLIGVIEQATAHDPENRFPSMKAILEKWPAPSGGSGRFLESDPKQRAATTLNDTESSESTQPILPTTRVEGRSAPDDNRDVAVPALVAQGGETPATLPSEPTLASSSVTTHPPIPAPSPEQRRPRNHRPYLIALGTLATVGVVAVSSILGSRPTGGTATAASPAVQGAASSEAALPTAMGEGIRVGPSMSCAIMTDHAVRCWGNGNPTPTRIEGTEGTVELAVGASHACVIVSRGDDAQGEVKCWGDNTLGQLGDGTTSSRRASAARVELPRPISVIAVGATHACALTAADQPPTELYCWGANNLGQLGDGLTPSDTTSRLPKKIEIDQGRSYVVRVSLGRDVTCAIVKPSDETRCWGANDSGQAGQPPSEKVALPTKVPAIPVMNGLFAGDHHVCARESTSRSAWCWGRNDRGQLGAGRISPWEAPTRVVGLGGVDTLRAGASHTCALLIGKHDPSRRGPISRGKCWGANEWGQLGTGQVSPDQPTAIDTPLIENAFDLKLADHTCAMTNEKGVMCWGRNDAAQLGVSGVARSESALPVRF